MAEAEQRKKAAAAALVFVQAELASTRAELLPLRQKVTIAESLAQERRGEALHRLTLDRVTPRTHPLVVITPGGI